MKKMVVACALALAVTVASQQNARAWHEFKFSVGFDLSWKSADNCSSWYIGHSSSCGPYPGCGFDGYPSVGAMFQNYQGYAHDGAAPAASTAGSAASQTYAPYYNAGYQPVGYSYTGYSQYQSPSYWYGR
jgi:hypothetical protein